MRSSKVCVTSFSAESSLERPSLSALWPWHNSVPFHWETPLGRGQSGVIGSQYERDPGSRKTSYITASIPLSRLKGIPLD